MVDLASSVFVSGSPSKDLALAANFEDLLESEAVAVVFGVVVGEEHSLEEVLHLVEAGELVDAGWEDEVEEDPGVAVEPPCSCKQEVRLKRVVSISAVEPAEPLGLVGDPLN